MPSPLPRNFSGYGPDQVFRRWFSKVDGFYTNYAWKREQLQQTLDTFFAALSGNILKNKSIYDIYIGIDVFGRGCLGELLKKIGFLKFYDIFPGDGGWYCDLPLELIRHHSLSAAIFAPGWICEHFPDSGQQCLFDNTFLFWRPLKSLLFPHRLTQRSIDTNLNVGFSSEHSGCWDTDNDHYCMDNAGLQPFYLCSVAFRKDLRRGLNVAGSGFFE